ncbi:uncharacterized protein METZ01_LOCUS148506 [marine metagenome]|uniref:UDP-glucose 6-dehydrogenase n=1 Tax=marine metagenome TaxID=408172 RepID=A0A382A3C4_9ZZZZ
MSRIAIVGTGYVGLTAGACFAHLGHQVVCGDIDEAKVEELSAGRLPIVEAGLADLVREGLHAGRLSFVVGAAAAVEGCDVAFLCLPTPQNSDGSADTSFLEEAVRQVATVLPSGAIVVNKSTVPVGSTKVVFDALRRDDVAVVSNPEFLREGSAVRDFLEPDRVVVGADDSSAGDAVAALYAGVSAPVLITDPVTAETVKYAANAFLVTKLSFVNSIAAVCESVGADVDDVMVGLGYDRRIGSGYLRPGPGWGGSCFPKDTRSLLQMAGQAGYDFRFLDVAVAVNEEQFDRVADKVRKAAGGDLAGRTVAVWGLSFKAGTDDLRDSPALAVIDRMLAAGATIRAHDPTVTEARPPIPDDVAVVTDPLAACDGAEVLVVLTEWEDFQVADPTAVAARLTRPAVVDARNLLDRTLWEGHGFDYQGIGR